MDRGRPQRALELLTAWVERSVPADASGWLRQALRAVGEAADDKHLVRALSLAPRRLGRGDVSLAGHDLVEADRARPGWDPTGLSIDQAARIALVLASYRDDDAGFADGVKALYRTANINELITYCRGLAVFPGKEHLRVLAGEGVRSAMTPVFEAVAHRNPYPRDMFDEPSWNQMVVKSIFIGSTLTLVQGLDERANPELARMLLDYAEERRAAGRAVSPELWRCVGPFADERGFAALRHLLTAGSSGERHAAVLALRANARPEAREILALRPDVVHEVDQRSLTWADVI